MPAARIRHQPQKDEQVRRLSERLWDARYRVQTALLSEWLYSGKSGVPAARKSDPLISKRLLRSSAIFVQRCLRYVLVLEDLNSCAARVAVSLD
jgi:hypothetical protein